MNASQAIQMRRVWDITLVWLSIGLFVTIYDHFLLMSGISKGAIESYSFFRSLAFNCFAGLMGGFLGGIALTEINKHSRSRPYYKSILAAGGIFLLIVSCITLVTATFGTYFLSGNPFRNPVAQRYFFEQIMTTEHLKNVVFWGIVVVITQFTLQISDKFGPRNLQRMIIGKYHSPLKENRIFMFLDLKSSTTIAEKLGEEKYHEFLKEVFSDITDPILFSKAEIYQYVGDEVVVSWDMEREEEEKALCLSCFFNIREGLMEKKEAYEQAFGIFPEFKAGLHLGQVIAGEVGIIKREITYSGDVLNTAARIQSKCNALNSSLLISEKLKAYLSSNVEAWKLESRGSIYLKGKEKEMELYDVKQKVG
ncbi:MAG: adenylate/guanylate cyclase domain-containing protein [Bacteroidia bacterium]|nr:adenylate/guanylate cyclase domain-containing protein [Bacteroidia bacterium]